MAELISLDPFVLVRDLVSRLEKGINAFANPVMRSDGFARGANQAMSAAMVAKKLARALTQRYFEALNIPSRADIVALTDRLQALEDRMIGMQATLDRIAGGAAHKPAMPAPSRTRKPPVPAVDVVATPAPRRSRKLRP